MYHRLMQASWRTVILAAAAGYLITALGFAVLYQLDPAGITGSDGNFATAYWFSIQTLSTIGYGHLSPNSAVANVLVTIESFVGLAGVAVITALLYAKFAKPSARVAFSDAITIHEHYGVNTMHIRMANERTTPILDVHVHAAVLVRETDDQGHSFSRLHDLALVRNRIPLFALAFTLMHKVDETSPLVNADPEDIVFLIVSFHGTDDALLQPVFGRRLYQPEDVRLGRRFGDLVARDREDGLVLQLHKLHDTEPVEVNSEVA